MPQPIHSCSAASAWELWLPPDLWRLRSRSSPKPCRAVPYLSIYGACLIAVAFQLPIPVVVLLVALSGFAFISTMIRLGTALIQSSPDEYRGRITSLQSLGFRLGQPLGSLVAGFVAHEFGVQIAFWTFGDHHDCSRLHRSAAEHKFAHAQTDVMTTSENS